MQPPDDVDAHPSGASQFRRDDPGGECLAVEPKSSCRALTRAPYYAAATIYQPQTCAGNFRQAYKLTEHARSVDGSGHGPVGWHRLPTRDDAEN